MHAAAQCFYLLAQPASFTDVFVCAFVSKLHLCACNLQVRLHTEALLAKRAFWVALESHRLARFDKLAAAVNRIEASVKSAERMYRTVLARHSSSVKILQLYVKFLQGVRGDPWTAGELS